MPPPRLELGSSRLKAGRVGQLRYGGAYMMAALDRVGADILQLHPAADLARHFSALPDYLFRIRW